MHAHAASGMRFPAEWPTRGALPPAAVKVPIPTCPNASTHAPPHPPCCAVNVWLCRRLCDMGLKEVLEQHAASAAAAAAAAGDDGEGAEGENAASKRASKRQKQDENAAAGTKQITSFFHTAAVQ